MTEEGDFATEASQDGSVQSRAFFLGAPRIRPTAVPRGGLTPGRGCLSTRKSCSYNRSHLSQTLRRAVGPILRTRQLAKAAARSLAGEDSPNRAVVATWTLTFTASRWLEHAERRFSGCPVNLMR
jgi:hypothetical protein